MGFCSAVRELLAESEDPSADAARTRRTATVILLAIALLLVPLLWKPWIHGMDGVRNYAYLRSLWLDGDLDFRNEFLHYQAAGEYQDALTAHPATGRPGTPVGIGSAVLWTPFFLAGHLAARLSPGVEADGYSAPYAWAISAGSTLYALAGLLLLMRLLCWRFGSIEGLVGVLAVWLGSPLLFYMYLHPSMSHACSFFLFTLAIWQYERWRDLVRLRHFFLLGLVCGLAAATRFTNGVLGLLLVAFWLRTWYLGSEDKERFHSRQWLALAALSGFLGLLAGFAPQMAAWRVLHGGWLAGPYNGQQSLIEGLAIWKSPHIGHVLFSGWRGLFVWSPVLVFSVLGYWMLLRRRRLIDVTIAVMFLIQLWVVGGWTVWWGGASFGQRFFLSFTPGFATGLAWLFGNLRLGAPRRIMAALLTGCILWTGGLAVQYISGIVPREKEVRFSQLLSNQFDRVPDAMLSHLKFLWPGHRGSSPPEPEKKTP